MAENKYWSKVFFRNNNDNNGNKKTTINSDSNNNLPKVDPKAPARSQKKKKRRPHPSRPKTKKAQERVQEEVIRNETKSGKVG